MGIIIRTDKRRVIPRWRSFEFAKYTGELEFGHKQESAIISDSSTALKEQLESWKKKKDIVHAGDLLSSAYVLGLEDQYLDVIQFVLENENDINSPLFKLAFKLSKPDENDQNKSDLISKLIHKNFKSHNDEIRKYRNYLKREPKNPVAWIELGRVYSILGLIERAEKCINTSLALDKDNRFIVRSASRFFQHFRGDDEQALHVIKRSQYVSSDPWLISAEVAYSSILQRHSKMAKTGIRYLNESKYDSISLTELASAIGTLEFSNGQVKEARRYFIKSLAVPNDNSLAQVNWISSELPGLTLDMSKYNNLPLAFEAKAIDSFNRKKFSESLSHAQRWYEDEPYSTRPINFASYLAGVVLNDYARAIKLTQEGLEANPSDPLLWNNLVYYLIEDQQEDEAFRVYNSMLKHDFKDINEATKVTLTATSGLVLFRLGELEKGREFYIKAIDTAKKSKSKYLIALATVHFIREEMRHTENIMELKKLKNQLDLVCKDLDDPDLMVIHGKITKEYEHKL